MADQEHINVLSAPEQDEVNVVDSTKDTEEHRQEIARNIQHFCNKMSFRAAAHDLSKLQSPEKEGFDRAPLKLSDMTYNSQEYAKSLVALSDTLKHHYEHNDHHPQHFENGVSGMTLYALVEMYEDWKASVKRTKDGDILLSIEKNADKFNIEPQLHSILKNTALADLEEENNKI